MACSSPVLKEIKEKHIHRQKAMADLRKNLEAFLNEYEEIVLHVEKHRLFFKDELMHQGAANDGDLAFILFRDGIRRLSFRRGVESWEIDRFIRIFHRFKSLPAEADSDIVTDLWEAQFQHIQYEAIEKFLEVDLEAEDSSSKKSNTDLFQSTPSKETVTSDLMVRSGNSSNSQKLDREVKGYLG